MSTERFPPPGHRNAANPFRTVPLRIAHFVQRYPPALGGSEAYIQRLSRYLAARGHHVDVWTTNAVDLEAFWSRHGREVDAREENDRGVNVRRFRCKRWPLRRYTLKALSFLPGATWKAMTMPCNPMTLAMWSEAGRSDRSYDIVHATAFPYAWPIVCARRLARRINARFFITPFLHLGSPDVPDNRMRRAYLAPHLIQLLRSADGIFVQTPSERDAVIGIGVSGDRVRLQGMGVDSAECTGGDRVAMRQRLHLRESDLVVGHLANLSFEKGTIDLLLAAGQLWSTGAKFHVVLAGADMTSFRRFWASYPHQDRVTLLGVIDDQQKRDFFAGIDIFALPSRSDSFGLVLLEAWANRIPNIAYRTGGIADVIRHDHDGLLVNCSGTDQIDQRSIDGLSLALKQLMEDRDLRERYGTYGHERVVSEFQWYDKLHLVEDVYLSVKSS